MSFDVDKLEWTRFPRDYSITHDKIEIVNVSADESILDENGRIDAKKLDPIIYDGVSHAYWSFGEKVGLAFSDGKKLK